MAQPKDPPLSFRPGPSRLAEVDAWATDHGLSRHAAFLALIDVGLGKGGAARAAPAPKPAAPVPLPVKERASGHGVEVPLAGTFERKAYQKGTKR